MQDKAGGDPAESDVLGTEKGHLERFRHRREVGYRAVKGVRY